MYEATRHDICLAALELWGAEAQTLMVMEEMSELQKELCKHARGAENREAIAEEIADVRIMLDQMCILHDCAELAEEYEHMKLDRLLCRIEKEIKADEFRRKLAQIPEVEPDEIDLAMIAQAEKEAAEDGQV